uniref:zinc finger protein 431-like n=1 Tax=Arvicanthis niloticus TaxID=61156 RepID=UPI00148723E6
MHFPVRSPTLEEEGKCCDESLGKFCSQVLNAMNYDDVHVNFTAEEWSLLDSSQKNRYKDVMLETYWNLTAIGYNLKDHHIEEQNQTSRSHKRHER